MAASDSIMHDALKRLHPFSAFVILCSGIFSSEWIAELFRPIASEGAMIGIAKAIGLFFYIGWSLVIGVAMQNHAIGHDEQRRLAAFIGFLYALTVVLVTYPIADYILKSDLEMDLVIEAMELGLVAMIVAALYVQRFGAKMLVAAEEGRPVRFFDYWGTWLLFFFLPVGIIFLQRRVRRVVLSASKERP